MLGEEGLSKDGKVLVRSIDNGYQELLPGKEMMNSFYSLLGTEEKSGVYEMKANLGIHIVQAEIQVYLIIFFKR